MTMDRNFFFFFLIYSFKSTSVPGDWEEVPPALGSDLEPRDSGGSWGRWGLGARSSGFGIRRNEEDVVIWLIFLDISFGAWDA